MSELTWKCPKCRRTFSRKGQRHACGTGDRNIILRDRAPALVKIYEAIESYAKSLGDVEIVARDRYALFRTKRIFADLVMMKEAVRLAIHLRRRVSDPMFFKTAEDRGRFTHVVKLQQLKTVAALKPLLKEAYTVSLGTSL